MRGETGARGQGAELGAGFVWRGATTLRGCSGICAGDRCSRGPNPVPTTPCAVCKAGRGAQKPRRAPEQARRAAAQRVARAPPRRPGGLPASQATMQTRGFGPSTHLGVSTVSAAATLTPLRMSLKPSSSTCGASSTAEEARTTMGARRTAEVRAVPTLRATATREPAVKAWACMLCDFNRRIWGRSRCTAGCRRGSIRVCDP